jgi:hypothetical protein
MFRRILKCEFEFVEPWWDDISLSAKVTTKFIKLCALVFNVEKSCIRALEISLMRYYQETQTQTGIICA